MHPPQTTLGMLNQNIDKRKNVPNSNLEGWLGMKMVLREMRQGLALASSEERGLALTET